MPGRGQHVLANDLLQLQKKNVLLKFKRSCKDHMTLLLKAEEPHALDPLPLTLSPSYFSLILEKTSIPTVF